MYDYPEWVNAEESIDNLITAIKNSLQLWLDIHTNAEAWAQEWNTDDNWFYLLKNVPKIENNYFSFDLKRTVLEVYAKDTLNNMYRCKRCGSFWAAGYEECDCEGQEYDDNDYEQLTDDDLDEFIEWLDDIGGINENIVSEWMIEEAMINEGFTVYQNALSSTIQGVVEEVEEALKQFKNAQSNEDLLYIALSASSILHVNGNILTDYGDRIGLDYKTVCLYRDNGISALFSKEEINDFINADKIKA